MVETIKTRAGACCELCGNPADRVYFIDESSPEMGALLCDECFGAVEFNFTNKAKFECLSEAMWSEIPAVKILSYQILNALKDESFARELLDILYIEDELKSLAKMPPSSDAVEVFDSNGNKLSSGDSVSIIKDLEVKGANFTAKRGTTVKNIALNGVEGQIEGRVNGVKIVLLSKFLKKI